MLVFEDLHWADDAMLAFLEHLADSRGGRAAAVGRHGPSGAVRASSRLRQRAAQHDPISLAPLSRGGDRPSRLGIAGDDRPLRRAAAADPGAGGGNPLYAEEFVRLLKDRDLLVRKGGSWELKEGAEVPFPTRCRR